MIPYSARILPYKENKMHEFLFPGDLCPPSSLQRWPNIKSRQADGDGSSKLETCAVVRKSIVRLDFRENAV